MPSNCPRCGLDLPSGEVKFCPECGAPIDSARSTKHPNTAATPPPLPSLSPVIPTAKMASLLKTNITVSGKQIFIALAGAWLMLACIFGMKDGGVFLGVSSFILILAYVSMTILIIAHKFKYRGLTLPKLVGFGWLALIIVSFIARSDDQQAAPSYVATASPTPVPTPVSTSALTQTPTSQPTLELTNQTPTPTSTPTPDPTPAVVWEWQLARQWSGNASKNTETFSITAPQWAIKWASWPCNDGSGGHFGIVIKDAVTNAYIDLAVNRVEPGQDITYQRNHGQFFLEISGDDHPWQIQIYEYRPVLRSTSAVTRQNSPEATAASSVTKPTPTPDPNRMVYITPDTKKYHAVICRHMIKGSKPMPLSKALEAGYTPCEDCLSPPLGIVYARPFSQRTSPAYREPIYSPPAQQTYGACPKGGAHSPGKVDARGHLHCAKCGQFM